MTESSDHFSIQVASPMAGWVWPLTDTPDAVFADGIMGAGVALDPVSGEVLAPFDGVVATLNPSRHAVIVRHASGLELLIHVGIDTVALSGRGFEASVAVGQTVRAGEVLVRFDLDSVARGAPSLISPVLVVNGDDFEVVTAPTLISVAVGAPLMTVRRRVAQAPSGAHPASGQASDQVRIGLEHGVHARPAAAMARIVKSASVSGQLRYQDKIADLHSVVAVMALSLKAGDQVALKLTGGKADAALAELRHLLEGAFAEAAPAIAKPQVDSLPERVGLVRGVCGAPGLAVGPAFHVRPAQIVTPEAAISPAHEAAILQAAIAEAAAELRKSGGKGALSEVLDAHLGLIEDAELSRLALQYIAAGKAAGPAWSAAIASCVARFEAASDERLVERASDLRDVERQVLRRLPGAISVPVATPPAGAILLAEDLLPSQLADFDPLQLAGVCLSRGGPTSHVAIIAASLGLPLLAAAGLKALTPPDGRQVILDADQGELHLHPTDELLAETWTRLGEDRLRARLDLAAAASEAVTQDRQRIAVYANLGSASEAASAVALGAEGSGLLRSEFLFMDRETPPSEAEQRAVYQAVLDGLGGRPLTLRTLDAGGDKPIAYLPQWVEANPALGLRGVRTSLALPDLLRDQLAAMAAVQPAGLVSIMAPMITDLGELRRVRAVLNEVCVGLGLTACPALGVMIETPASVLLAGQLAAEADFFSIGTNDLAQYVLAMDRTNPQLALASDPLHPAVLRAIGMAVQGAAQHGRKVSVCGGLASDLEAIPLLLGLGISSLSCTPSVIPAAKSLIRTLSASRWQEIASRALDLEDAAAVRALVRRVRAEAEV
jgi:phosphocarrier protein FPr/phosphocarrier protein